MSCTGYREDVATRFLGSGFSIHEAAYTWGAGAEMATAYESVELHYRLSPGRVQARMSTGNSGECLMGQVLLIPPLAMRARSADKPETVRTLLCRFDRTWLEDLVGARLDWRPESLAVYGDINVHHITSSMRRIADEVSHVHTAGEAMIAGLSQCLAVDVARRFGSVVSAKSDCRSVVAAERVRWIQKMVHGARDRLPGVADIAAALRLSPACLRRMFREETGNTLREFLEESRISMACRLLRETDLAIKVISYRVGFAHHSAFSFAFNKKIGVTPKYYRAMDHSNQHQ